MKRITHLFLMTLGLVLSAIPMYSWGQGSDNPNVVLMPQFGMPEDGAVIVSDEITFYDHWGEDMIKGSSSYNSLSAVVFKPAEEGKVIQITFESVEVLKYETSWTTNPAYLNIYNGILEPGADYKFPTTTYGVSNTSKLPEGELLETLSGTYTNKTYFSTDPSGALSVGFHFVNATNCSGWVAKVSCVKVEDMTVIGAGSSYEQVETEPVAKKAVNLVSFYVDTEGIMKPENLTSVSFTLPINEVVEPGQLKLYAGAELNFDGETPLETTFTENDGTYTLTLAKALSSGRNWFSIAGDVKADAAFGAKVQTVVSKVTTTAHTTGVEGFIAATPVTLTIPHTVLMSATPATYQVGSDNLFFYDDGGKDGKISSKFEGTVTFVPTTPGNKIQIDFSKVSLYENIYSTSTNDDVMKIYDGKTVSEADLNTIMRNGVPAVVKSMAEDGSLTVYLKTIQITDYNLKDGFEAVVSEYTPVQMEVKEIVPAQYTEGTVVAGDVSQPILSVNIKTENTIPLVAQAFKFTAEGTTVLSHLSKATVYYTGKSNVFANTVKVGEVDLTGNAAFELSGCSQSLVEGDNYFWLAYDLKADTQSGEVIDGGCTGITLSGQSHAVANGNPEGFRTVKNEYLSVVGTFEKTIFGTWDFASTKNPSSYYDGYNPVEGDQIVTFIPGTKGMIAELEFSDFHLYYYPTASSYYPRAKFEVYSGKGTGGKLLWSLTTADDKDKGPERILRSESADGALTVVFDAKTTSASYTAKGWQAEVREYLSVPMEFSSVNAFQASTQVIPTSPATANQEVIGFKILTAGDKTPLSLEEITLNMKGAQDKVSKVYVYTSGKDSVLNLASPIAEALPDASSAALKLTLTNPLELLEGASYYWIAYDMKENVAAEQSIDAALTSVKVSGDVKEPVSGDPAGERVTKSIYVMKSGENGTIKVGSQSLMFYDEGGVEGGITRGFKGTVTFEPEHAGKTLKLTLKKWNIGGSDKMYVYYGGEKGDKEDLLIESTKYPQEVVSFSEDGKITLYFQTASYGSSTGLDGFEIEVSEYEIQPLSLGGLKVVPVNERSFLRGANAVMLRVDVEIKGDKGEFTLDALKFSNEGTSFSTDIASARVYCTDTVSVFMNTNQYGETLKELPYQFDGNYTATLPGIYKFWLVYDISGDALTGNTIKATPVSVTAQGTETQIEEPFSAEGYIVEGFKGTYTVGVSDKADYASIGDAVNAMKDGIDGPVVFELENGTYNEVVNIAEIKGTSAVNTITIKSKSGSYRDVKIVGGRYIAPDVDSNEKVHAGYGVVTVAGADYFTLDGVTVTSSDVSYPAIVRLKDASCYVTVRNCYLYTEMSADMSLIETYSRNIAADTNDYLVVENCLLEGANKGMSLGASWVNTPSYEAGACVRNNTFRNQGAKAIYLQGMKAYSVTGNEFYNDRATASYTALDMRRGFEQCVIADNIINLATSKDATGIYTEYIKAGQEAPGSIHNNEINIVCNANAGAYSSFYGIKVGSKEVSTNLNIVYNTVRLTGVYNSSAALFINSSISNGAVRNNILQNEATGHVYRIYSKDYFTGIVFSNNMTYTSGTAFAYAGTAINDFEAWKVLSGEKDSYNEQTSFLSETVLEPAQTGNLKNAKPLAFVTTDLNGTVRDEQTPTIGAYEYGDVSDNTPVLVEGYPSFSNITHEEATAVLKVDLSGKVFLLVKEKTAVAPTQEEVLASEQVLQLRKGKEASVVLSSLANQTEYILYVVLQNLKEVSSEVIASDVFTTTYTPTAVSTFEKVTAVEGDFEDGTAKFSGFTVEDADDTVVVGKKVAKIGTKGTITFTNSDKGIPLTGFFLKAGEPVTMDVYDEADQKQTFTLGATDGKWVFSNLKDKGLITKIEMTSTGDAYLDNFSGEPLDLLVYIANRTVQEKDRVTLTATVSTGVAPYTYVWKNAMQEVVSTEVSYAFDAKNTTACTLTVTDAWGATDTDEVVITVEGNAYTATFEDVYLKEESYWNGEGEDDFAGNGTFSTLYSGSYAFSNNRHTSTYWSGFACSNQTSVEYSGLSDQYRSAVGSGHNSDNYAVSYVYTGIPHAIDVTNNKAEGDSIRGFYVSNTAWVKESVLKGDGQSDVAGGFVTGDYLKLIITGKAVDNTTTSLDYYLADYTSKKEADHYCLDTWQWVDLRPLGKVKAVSFRMEGTKQNSYGLTTPTYFCMDDFNGYREVKQGAKQDVGFEETVINLAQFFTFDDADASIDYQIEEPFDDEVATITLEDGKLLVTGKEAGSSLSLLVSAVQKGKIQFVQIPLTVNKAIGMESNRVRVSTSIYPVPAIDKLNIVTELENYTIEVIAVSGAKVLIQENNSGDATIVVGGLEKGMYLLKLYNAEQTVVKRFTVK